MQSVISIDDGFDIIKIENDSTGILKFESEVDNSFIQIHFCLNGNAQLQYGPYYSKDVRFQKSLLMYNPKQNLPINLSLDINGRYLILIVRITLFHSFFSKLSEIIHFLNIENRGKKYYLDKDLSPSEILVLNQIFDYQKHNGMQELYIKAKVYETLSLYFDRSKEERQNCPFLDDEANVEKIKMAKQIVINKMTEPPSLKEISTEIGLSVSKLKEGFKHIYGESVFNFLFDYKMEFARKQLLSRKFNVSEVSQQVGYSTSSHFIAAFRKKYGTTPKQYIISES